MKFANIISTFLFFTVLTLSAQEYSPCYTSNMAKGDAAFKQGKYTEAKNCYSTAKKCAGGNPTVAQQKINSCDAKIKTQQEAAEAKRKAEQEAADAKRKAEAEAEEAKRKVEWEAKKAKEAAEKEAKEQLAQEEERKAEEAAKNDAQRLSSLTCRSQSYVTDYDGNRYRTVQIGSQCWMAENLRTTHYANGVSIKRGNDDTTSSVAYYAYPKDISNNDMSSYGSLFNWGLLYNWKAAMGSSASSGSNSGNVQGICPRGWHIPSENELKQLIEYVSNQSRYLCSGQSNYISKALASKVGWIYNDGDCQPSNTFTSNNATGFSAVPAGYLSGKYYMSIGHSCYIWSSSSTTYVRNKEARVLSFHNISQDILITSKKKACAYSVRCIKD